MVLLKIAVVRIYHVVWDIFYLCCCQGRQISCDSTV